MVYKNGYPLLSMCYAHVEHSFDRKERMQYLLVMLSLTFVLAAMFGGSLKESEQACERCESETGCIEPIGYTDQEDCGGMGTQSFSNSFVVALITIPPSRHVPAPHPRLWLRPRLVVPEGRRDVWLDDHEIVSWDGSLVLDHWVHDGRSDGGGRSPHVRASVRERSLAQPGRVINVLTLALYTHRVSRSHRALSVACS